MRTFIRQWLLLAVFATGSTAFAADPAITLPDLGSAGMGSFTASQEEAIGRRIVMQMYDAGIVIEDPELQQYIDDIGARLVGASETRNQEFSFYVIDNDSVNAFALPGGHIGIHTGLIRRTRNESELAGVIAHEIAHVTQRHIARRVEESRTLGLRTLAAMLGAFAVAAAGGGGDDVAGALMLGQGLLHQQQINFTRSQEYEADRVGIELLANADFDPGGMVSFFETMQRKQRLQGISLPEYFSTHPLGTSRVVEATQRVRRLDATEGRESRMYPLVKARLDAMADDVGTKPGPADENAAADALYNIALKHMKFGSAEEAVDIFRWLVNENDSLVPYHLGLVRALSATGDREAAIAAINEALRLFPESVPAGITYAKVMRDFDEPARGLRHLRRLFDYRTPSPSTLRLMAQLAADADATAESHYYLSEFYIRQGDLDSARLQLHLAVDHADLGSNERRQYQARLEEISEILARQRLQRTTDERRRRTSGRGFSVPVY